MSWRRRPTGSLANSGQFRSDSIRRLTRSAVEHLRVDVDGGIHFHVAVPARNLIGPDSGTCHRSPKCPIVLIAEVRIRARDRPWGPSHAQA